MRSNGVLVPKALSPPLSLCPGAGVGWGWWWWWRPSSPTAPRFPPSRGAKAAGGIKRFLFQKSSHLWSTLLRPGEMWDELNSGSWFQGKTKKIKRSDVRGEKMPYSSGWILPLHWFKWLIKASLTLSWPLQDYRCRPFPKGESSPYKTFHPQLLRAYLQCLLL